MKKKYFENFQNYEENINLRNVFSNFSLIEESFGKMIWQPNFDDAINFSQIMKFNFQFSNEMCYEKFC